MADPLVCVGCGLLCDDVTAEIGTADGSGLTPRCPVGDAWLSTRLAAASDGRAATVDGTETDVETALHRAAELLRDADRPMLHGFAEATVEDARAAVALADRIGAVVCTGPVGDAWAGGSALALRGASTATLGEIRDRVRLVVVWREDPETTHPRLLARLGFGAGAAGSRVAGTRTLAVVDDRDTATARIADVRLRWTAERDLEVLRWLLADRCGAAGDGIPVGSELAELLLTSVDHAAVVYGPGLVGGAGGERRALALHGLARAYDAGGHVVTLALPATPGARAADDVLTWQTGYPGTVDLASGHPELVMETRDLVTAEGVDVTLCVAGGETAPTNVARGISFAPVAPDRCAVWIRTAAAGLQAPGTAHRLDGVPLGLPAPFADATPTAAELLQRLEVTLAR